MSAAAIVTGTTRAGTRYTTATSCLAADIKRCLDQLRPDSKIDPSALFQHGDKIYVHTIHVHRQHPILAARDFWRFKKMGTCIRSAIFAVMSGTKEKGEFVSVYGREHRDGFDAQFLMTKELSREDVNSIVKQVGDAEITCHPPIDIKDLAIRVIFEELDSNRNHQTAFYPLAGAPKRYVDDMFGGKPNETVAIWKRIVPNRTISCMSLVKSATAEQFHYLGLWPSELE